MKFSVTVAASATTWSCTLTFTNYPLPSPSTFPPHPLYILRSFSIGGPFISRPAGIAYNPYSLAPLSEAKAPHPPTAHRISTSSHLLFHLSRLSPHLFAPSGTRSAAQQTVAIQPQQLKIPTRFGTRVS